MAAWERQSTRMVYRNEFVSAHEDILMTPRGGTMAFLRLVSPSFACAVPVTEDGKIVFVREYRPALGTTLLEIPGGRIEPGEEPRHAARRRRRPVSVRDYGSVPPTPPNRSPQRRGSQGLQTNPSPP